jgi:glycosyltransferase involved in cell wall biosynthesis
VSATQNSSRPLRVVHVSSSDIGGGAAMSAYRLHRGLLNIGMDSQMVVSNKASDDFTVHGTSGNMAKLWSRVANQIDQVPRKFLKTANQSLISPAWVRENTAQRILALQPDVVNLHWTQNAFLRPESLRLLSHLPVVWTLHDMWAFSGGEHYVGDDMRYVSGYTEQNRPQGESGFDLNRWLWERKRKAWKHLSNITVVTPSRWLGACAQQSVLFSRYRVETIPYGLDLTRFKPIDKRLAREILNLPQDKLLLMFGAMSATSDTRKGFQFLAPALTSLAASYSPEDVAIVIFGSSTPKNPVNMGFPAHYLGHLHDAISTSLAYAAADVFIAPSMEDNLPNTVLESLACGTPVVAFDIGGMPDMILHEKNGYLAKAFDVQSLARGIAWVLEENERRISLSTFARKRSEEGFTLEHQAHKYEELYHSLVSK